MNLIERVKRLVLSPRTEWPAIAEERTETATLLTGYVLPLVAISAAAGFISGSIIGTRIPFVGGTYRIPIMTGLWNAVLGVALTVGVIYLWSLIINALAPRFGAQKNRQQALKVAAYSATPGFVAGVFQLLPWVGTLVMLIAAVYAVYLLYLGLQQVMKTPDNQALGYTAVVVVCGLVAGLVLSLALAGAGFVTGGAPGIASLTGGDGEVVFEGDTALGAFANGLEEAAKRMEAAEQSGDQGAQVAAAFEGLGALLAGGTRAEPLPVEQIRSFVPETFAGLPRTSQSAERGGLGITVSRAEATYGDGGGRQVKLELVDTGGAAGLLGVASWMGVEEEREDENGYERTRQEDGRYVHERVSTRGGANEFGVVIGQRFLVSAEGTGLAIDELKAAVSTLDLSKLEALKRQGGN